jgi:integrase/recombinase XerD
MTDRFFPNPAIRCRLHAGPLGSYIDTYAALLAQRGYARATSREYLRLVARLSRWLCKQRLRVDDLDEQRVNEFLEYRCRRGFIARSNAAALKALLKELRTAGIVRARIPHTDNSPLDKIGTAYSQYLAQERGLSQQTLANYLPVVRRFLTKRFGEGSIRLDELRATDITPFVLRYAHTMSPGRASLMVTALRSFLRFLHLRGEIATNLAGAVPTVPNWRFSTVPKFLEPAEVERLLKSCDQSTIIGQRTWEGTVMKPGNFPGLLEAFFTDRLMRQRQASPRKTAAALPALVTLAWPRSTPSSATPPFRSRAAPP